MAHLDIKQLAARFVLAGCLGLCLTPHAQAQSSQETVFWESVRDSGSADQLRLYISRYPDGVFRDLAQLKLNEMQGEADAANRSARETCDLLAGHEHDETLSVAPTSFDDLKSHVGEALAACKLAHESGGDPRYTFEYARALVADGQEPRAFELYKQAADAGHFRAGFRVGLTYEMGNYGISENRAAALEVYEKLAAAGHAMSAFRAGWLLDNALEGDGFARDYDRAYEYYRQAEAGGDVQAYYPLGFMHEKGRVVEEDVVEAIRYYRLSIQHTGFNRDTVRKRLSDLLAKQFEYLLHDQIVEREELAPEITKLLMDRAGTDRAAHDYAVERAAWLLAYTQQLVIGSAYPEPANTDLVTANQDSMRRMSELVVMAMNARHEAFPEALAHQTPDFNAKIVEELLGLFKMEIERYYNFSSFRRYSKDRKASSCLSIDTVWYKGDLVWYVNNLCRFDVLMRSETVISYPGTSYEPAVTHREDRIEADDSEEIWIRVLDRDSDQSSNSRWRTCYARDGFSEESDWTVSKYGCGYAQHYTDAGIKSAREQIEYQFDRIVDGL